MISRDQSFMLDKGKLILGHPDIRTVSDVHVQHPLSCLLNESFSVYFLNDEGGTLLINEFGADICGFDSPYQSLGKSLFDVSDDVSAHTLIQNSQQVLKTKTLTFFDELNIRKDKRCLQFLSIKLPWATLENKHMGSVGFSIVLSENNLSESLSTLSTLGILSPTPLLSTQTQNRVHHGVHLTKREKECLALSIKHFTAKQIAQHLGLSYRTVEEYLSNLKRKFGVSTKKELLQKAMC